MTRKPLVLWHRWFGLIAALWLFLMGLTGSILVFYEEIDRAINPQLFTAQSGPMQSVKQLVAAAQAYHPELAASYVDLPNEAGDAVMVGMTPPLGVETKSEIYQQVYIDPVSANILGSRNYHAIDLSPLGLMNFLYTFHYSLHLGETVVWLLGVISLAWLIDHIVSVWISFPNARKWRESFRIRRGVSGHKRTFDLHRAGGLWLFPVTAMLAFSGVYFNMSDEFRAVVNAVSPLSVRPDEAADKLPAPITAPRLSFDHALTAAAGSAKIDGIAYNASKGLYWVRAFDPERDIDKYGRRWIFVDATSGRILSDRHITDGSAGDIVMAWQFPLHSGKAFGWWGRIAIFLAGIATCSFIVTGLMMWNRKRGARTVGAMRRSFPELQPAE